MWDYSFAIPSILILSILLSNYFLLKRLPLRVNRSFVNLLLVETIVISSDIAGSWACEHYLELPSWFFIGTNMIFFTFFVLRSYAFFVYTCSFLGLNPSDRKLRTFLDQLPLIICEIMIVSSPWTRAIFYFDATGYKEGTCSNAITYVFAFYIICSALICITHKKFYKHKREMFGVIVYLWLLTFGLIISCLLPSVLIIDTFCIMAILVINLVYMNPDFYIERRTRLFNTDGLTAYLNEISWRRYTKVCAFVINHYQETVEIYGMNQMDRGIGLIGSYLKKSFPNALLFYYRTGRFIIIAKENADVDKMLEQITDRFKSAWIADDVELYLSVSYAKVSCNYSNYSTDNVLNVIANALASVGTKEGENVIINEQNFIESNELTSIKRTLGKALDSHTVEVFLQPIVDAHTFDVVGAESLCRIRDDDGNIIPPGKFIPIAENNGRINQLGEQVFEKTCKFVHDQNLNSFGMKWINVNLSTAHFLKNDLSETLKEVVDRYNVSPSDIHLEITEAAIVDESIMASQIQKIQELGFAFALDDYGTGYSNLNRLTHFPFINVKIDLSLVWDYCKDKNTMLPTLIKTLKDNGYEITAEGIETLEMAKAMEALGCDYLQGFYFSKPIPKDEYIAKYKKS